MRFGGFLVSCLLLFSWSLGFSGQVLIGEVDAFGELPDALGEGEDWIELWNAGPETASLQGMYLSDDADTWEKWALPDINLLPDQRWVVFASGRDVGGVDHWSCPVMDTDPWRFVVPAGALASDWRQPDFDDSGWSLAAGGFGYGDGDDGTVLPDADVIFLRRTWLVSNVEDIVHGMMAVDYDDGCVVYLNGRELFRSATMEGQSIGHDVFANGLQEAQLYQGGVPEQRSFDPREWLVEGDNVLAVQVHNENAGSSDLSARPFLALAHEAPAEVPFTPLPDWWAPDPPGHHANFKLKPGEPVILSDGDAGLLDVISLPQELRLGYTLGRSGTGGEDWCWFEEGTPGAPNDADCLQGILASPEVTPGSGHYPGPPLVQVAPGTLSGPPGQEQPAVVYRYTTNGAEPTVDSPVFTGGWNPGETIILSVKAFAEGWVPSATVDRTYFIAEPGVPPGDAPLERVSILTHPDHLWDWETGIYVLGPNAGPDYPFMGANFWQPWSKESRLEWFGEDGAVQATARFDLEIHGGWSRAEPQRSFRLDFKPKWTGPLDHAVFPSKPDIHQFGNLNLRNGGQASWENKIQDAFLGELALRTHAVASAWRPVEVYLNGDYWGVYGAREKSDENFVEDNFGWEADGVDLFNQWESQNGSPSAWEASVAPILGLPSASVQFEQEFASNFDVQSYFDYHIIEIHGQNVDWMTAPWGLKNFKYFRSLEGDRKWRPILYDTDACFGAWGTSEWEDYLQLTINPPFPSSFSDLFGKVLDNEVLGCGFATRYCDLLSTVFAPDDFNAALEEAAAWVGPFMERHIEMWNSPASLDYWQMRIELLQERNALRIDPSREHLRSHFGFNDAKALTIDWDSPIAGEVQVNGMSGLDLGWQGHYFGECPITLAAIPVEGYGFMGWEDNVHTQIGALDPTLPFAQLSLIGDDTFHAQFGPCLTGVDLSVFETADGLEAVVTGSAQPLTLQWWLDGLLVGSGSTWQGAGQEEVLVTASNGSCTLFSSAIEGQVMGVHAASSEVPVLRAVPNSARGVVRIEGRGRQLRVVNATGQVQHEQAVASWPVRLDLTGWPVGVYVLLAEGAEGVLTSRLVVE